MGNRSLTALNVIQKHHVDLSGKTALVTGCTSGIGIEIARALASARATVFITGRNVTALNIVRDQLNAQLRSRGLPEAVHSLDFDLSSMTSVRAAAASFKAQANQLHILVLNAALMAVDYGLSAEGLDMQMAVNHVANFLLFTLLRDVLLASAPARVVSVSSSAFYQLGPPRLDYSRLPSVPAERYKAMAAYQQSKLANVLFARQVHALYAGQGLTAYSLHPGVIRSGLQAGMIRVIISLVSPFLKSTAQGAATPVYCATAPGLEGQSGEFFADCAVTDRLAQSKITQADAEELWAWSDRLVQQHASK
jgi:NAD(P)-dependent dehydrogenase (short-subunit alcohol dehydrogenase family)